MSRLDENGKWRKHWFVLTDGSLKYYRDSEAEESDDLDGEIALTSCVNVSACDVEKNYGFQIHTKRAVFTLSALTSRIRRNWVKLLKQLTCGDSSYEATPAGIKSTVTAAASHRADPPSDLSPASQREAGEGWDREQAKRLEERNKWFEEGIPFSEMGSRWDSMELKKGSVPVPVTDTIDSEVSRKWLEFERMSFREMRSSNQALSLRQQVESIKRERVAMGMEVDSPCGPGAPCRARLEAMEAAHRSALQELQEKHAREIRELERQRDRMLEEESQAAAKAMEALRAAHREELDREVERARRLAGGAAHVDTAYRGQTPQAEVLHSELDVLSERYSQKCLELSRTEQSSRGRETELGRKERELEQLRRENQELKARLAEEISRMRPFITGQKSEMISLSKTERSASDVEVGQ
uniref:PH domain-containing protein n=1 Tax=Myripristis murdjan TaxID=586833 RepID=A0A668AZW6_9TELE